LFNKLTPLPEGPLRTRVESLAGRLGFPLKHLYVIDGSKRSSHSNAWVVWRLRRERTAGLIGKFCSAGID
jgi:STE24 endopeptidase